MRLGEDEFHFLTHVIGQLHQVLLIGARQDNAADAGSARGQHFFLDAADRQHQAGQRDFAGHGRVAARRPGACKARPAPWPWRRRRWGRLWAPRRPGRGCGRRPCGTGPDRCPAPRRATRQIALRRLGRLAHHFAELAGQPQAVARRAASSPRHTALRRPLRSRPGRSTTPGGKLLAGLLLEEALRAEQVRQIAAAAPSPAPSCPRRSERPPCAATRPIACSSWRTPASRV